MGQLVHHSLFNKVLILVVCPLPCLVDLLCPRLSLGCCTCSAVPPPWWPSSCPCASGMALWRPLTGTSSGIDQFSMHVTSDFTKELFWMSNFFLRINGHLVFLRLTDLRMRNCSKTDFTGGISVHCQSSHLWLQSGKISGQDWSSIQFTLVIQPVSYSDHYEKLFEHIGM